MESFWKDFTEFETSQVIKLEINEEEKKERIKQQLTPFVDAHTQALQLYRCIHLLIRSSKQRGEYWSPINTEHLTLPQSDDEDRRQIAFMKKAIQ